MPSVLPPASRERARARELDELGGSRNKPTSPDVGGCRERFYLGGGMLVCCYERRGPRPPPDELATRDFPDGTTLTYPVDGICYTALSLRETSNAALGPKLKNPTFPLKR
jgi:hypothetical protein